LLSIFLYLSSVDPFQITLLAFALTTGAIVALVLSIGTCVVVALSILKQLYSSDHKKYKRRAEFFHWTSETRQCPFCNKLKDHDQSCPHRTLPPGEVKVQGGRSDPPPTWPENDPPDDGATQNNYSFHSASHHPWLFDEVQKKKRKISRGIVVSTD